MFTVMLYACKRKKEKVSKTSKQVKDSGILIVKSVESERSSSEDLELLVTKSESFQTPSDLPM